MCSGRPLPAFCPEAAPRSRSPSPRRPSRSPDRRGTAVTMNGTVPAPLLRFREGDDAVIHVTNRLGEDTSIHWPRHPLAERDGRRPARDLPGHTARRDVSPTVFRSGSTAPTGTTATRAFRSSWATTGPSSSIPRTGSHTPTTASTSWFSRIGRSRTRTASSRGSRRAPTPSTSRSAQSGTSSATPPTGAWARRSGIVSIGAGCA